MSSQASKVYECGRCGKSRVVHRFSDAALKRYHRDVVGAKRGNKPLSSVRKPVCTECAAPTVHEYECSKCGQTKVVEDFSRQQRKQGDDRECKDCVQERMDREPVFADEVREYEIIEAMTNGISALEGLRSVASVVAPSTYSALSTTDLSPATTTSSHDTQGWLGEPFVEHPMLGMQGAGAPVSVTRSTVPWSSIHNESASEMPHGSIVSEVDRFDRAGKAPSSYFSEGSRFPKEGAVKLDPFTKAARQVERLRAREKEEAEQQQLYQSEDEGSDDDDPPY